MPLRTYSIYIETPVGTPLGDSMTEMRPWLDRHKIEPVEFKSEAKTAPSPSISAFAVRMKRSSSSGHSLCSRLGPAFRRRADDLAPNGRVGSNLLHGAQRRL